MRTLLGTLLLLLALHVSLVASCAAASTYSVPVPAFEGLSLQFDFIFPPQPIPSSSTVRFPNRFFSIDQVMAFASGIGSSGMTSCDFSNELPARLVSTIESSTAISGPYTGVPTTGNGIFGGMNAAQALLDGTAGISIEIFAPDPTDFCVGGGSPIVTIPPALDIIEFEIQVDGIALCDFDDDGACDVTDINSLIVQTTLDFPDLRYDMDGDDDVSLADIDEWLYEAALTNGFSSAYKRGDFNLDGIVDGTDFIAWNENRFTNTMRWDFGDVNTDFIVDGQDFILWNANRFTASDVANLPEPASALALVIGVMGCAGLRRTADTLAQ